MTCFTFCWDRESQATKTGSCKRFGVDAVQHKKLIEIIYTPSRKLTSPLPGGTFENDLPFAQLRYVSHIRKKPIDFKLPLLIHPIFFGNNMGLFPHHRRLCVFLGDQRPLSIATQQSFQGQGLIFRRPTGPWRQEIYIYIHCFRSLGDL